MNKVLYEKIAKTFSSVFPITVIVLIASVVLVPVPAGTILMFLGGAALLIAGMGFFSMGIDMSMTPLGEGAGVQLTHTAKSAENANRFVRRLKMVGALAVVIVISFIIGLFVTVAEPNLQVLARAVPLNIDRLPASLPYSVVMVVAIGIGVGIFLVIAVLRVIFRVSLSLLLVIFYTLTFAVVLAGAPENFISVAFDAGSITAGPMTVPFILALGIGVAMVRGNKGSQDDSFGFIALCSIGPILSMVLLGVIFRPDNPNPENKILFEPETTRAVMTTFLAGVPLFTRDVIQALSPLILFFIVFQIVLRRYKAKQVGRISIGFVYVFIGFLLFLTGVNAGFFPVGQYLGRELAASPLKWVLIPFGMLVGYFIVTVEPAIHILNKQIETVSSGAIAQKTMLTGLAIGMSAAVGITMARILFHINIMYILVPGYAIALALSFFVPKIFIGIAFDSGGVCSGPVTTTFLLPLALGACTGSGGNLMEEGFGVVALVAMTPVIVIQIIGLRYRMKTGKILKEDRHTEPVKDTGAIVIYDEV